MAKKLDFKDFLSVDYKPGSPDLIKKKAKTRKLDEDDFSPHWMYDPKTGDKKWTKKPEDHEKLDKMGWVHDKPKLDEETEKPVTAAQLKTLEKVLDQVFAKIGIDVEFTRHFLDRVNDDRNKTQITVRELALLFKKTFQKYGKPIAKLGPDAQAVLKDLSSDINLPFVLNWNSRSKMLELVAKTVMRKKNFTTPNKQFRVEDAQTEALSMQQRRNLSRKMKLKRSKIELGRKRSMNRAADPARLKRRAERAARNAIFKKLSKGKSKDDLSFQRRQEIEKRMDKMKSRIKRMAVKLLPRVRNIDKERRTKK